MLGGIGDRPSGCGAQERGLHKILSVPAIARDEEGGAKQDGGIGAGEVIGAGYYTDAADYLRQAFMSDPALMMGTNDITSVIGQDRVALMVADLKRIAGTSDSPTPMFLLAYISYNTGDLARAEEYLQVAQSRSGGQDGLLTSLSSHWALPQTQNNGATTKPSN